MNEASRGNDFTTSNLKHLAGAVFLIALSVRLVAVWKTGFFRHFEPSEMVRIALSLTKNQGYGKPFLIPTGPTAHQMPLYPMFMSVIYRVFGIGARAEAVKIALACTISAFRCALIPLFCLAINLGRRVAITAAIVSSFYITSLQTEVRGNWDGPWQTLALLILTWMTIQIWSSRSWMERTNFGYFILWGVTILLQPAFLPILAAFILAGLVACRNEARGRYLKQCSVLVLVVAAFLAPWVIRNDLQFGKMVITRDNFGLEFWVSNGPGRAFDADNNIVPHPSSRT